MQWVVVVVAPGFGDVVTAEVARDTQNLAGPDNARVADLVTIGPVEQGPEGCIVVNVRLGGNLGKSLTPLDGMVGGKGLLAGPLGRSSLRLGPGRRLRSPCLRRASFQLAAFLFRLFAVSLRTFRSTLRLFTL